MNCPLGHSATARAPPVVITAESSEVNARPGLWFGCAGFLRSLSLSLSLSLRVCLCFRHQDSKRHSTCSSPSLSMVDVLGETKAQLFGYYREQVVGLSVYLGQN